MRTRSVGITPEGEVSFSTDDTTQELIDVVVLGNLLARCDFARKVSGGLGVVTDTEMAALQRAMLFTARHAQRSVNEAETARFVREHNPAATRKRASKVQRKGGNDESAPKDAPVTSTASDT